MTPAAKTRALQWLSPSGIKNILACMKMHVTKSFNLGDIGKAGSLRHLALELHLRSRMEQGAEPIPLVEAAKMAGEEFKGKMGTDEIAGAVYQVSQTPEAGLPDPDMILSIEGSNLPAELMRKASNHPDAEPMLHVVIRDAEGPWGAPYGVRMKLDVLHLLDGSSDDLAVTDFKGYRPCYEPGCNDVQALVNFVGVVHIARALGLNPTKVRWVGLGIPSLIEDPHEFWVANYDSAISTLDKVNRTVTDLQDNPPETPGKHCGKCKLNGTARCHAWQDADKPVVVASQAMVPPVGDGIPGWQDDFLCDVYQALKDRAGQIESLVDLCKAEITKRSRMRQIGPPGFKYSSRSQGSSAIEWKTTPLLDLFEKWNIDPTSILGVTGSKKLVESMVKASTKDKLERENRLEQLKATYDQGRANILKLVPLASTDPAGVGGPAEPPGVTADDPDHPFSEEAVQGET